MKTTVFVCVMLCLSFILLCLSCGPAQQQVQKAPSPYDVVNSPYELNTGLVSRSISFESPTGAPGEGGKAISRLGVGRKGSPARSVKPDSMFVLCDIEGPGTIRHIWITTSRAPENLLSIVLRAYWDGPGSSEYRVSCGRFHGICSRQGKSL